ncbi:hypothetical protein CERZMDRAFT_92579 [Cercospora zeae-maydis SCOH1-5]|uniref:Uncharacterized protein n=1 Tax=Cercospora zeae-maydis SCOH1-5 TaxID=717836 RepID=A0A6A6FXJ7_9PEZI|nr:hypothetical protein CERZMDRAFT_92579 [Cercospora zeae-maydis SCOH1-5]
MASKLFGIRKLLLQTKNRIARTMHRAPGFPLIMLATCTIAYTIHGYRGPRCSGALAFNRTLRIYDGCVTDGVGQAESLMLEFDKVDRPDVDNVYFYENDRCDPYYLFLMELDGCVDVDDKGERVYKGFKAFRRG